MSWTKRQFIMSAFDEIGIASYEFDLQPDQIQSALNKLDAMMSAWVARGIELSYPISASQSESDLDQATGVPSYAREAIATNLAVRLAPSYGKTLSPATIATAKEGYNVLLRRMHQETARTLTKKRSMMPSGAGNKPWRYLDGEFVINEEDSPVVFKDGHLDF